MKRIVALVCIAPTIIAMENKRDSWGEWKEVIKNLRDSDRASLSSSNKSVNSLSSSGRSEKKSDSKKVLKKRKIKVKQ